MGIGIRTTKLIGGVVHAVSATWTNHGQQGRFRCIIATFDAVNKGILILLAFIFCSGVHELKAQSVSQAEAVLDSILIPDQKPIPTEVRFERTLKGLAVEDEPVDQSKLAAVYYLLAVDLWDLGLREQSLYYIQRSIDCSKTAKMDADVVFYRVGTKVAYLLEAGRADSALVLAHEALAMMYGVDSMYTAAALNNIGLCHFKLNESEKAKTYFDSALRFIPQATADHPQLVYLKMAVRDNIAVLLERENELLEARELVSQNIETLKTLPLKDHYWCSHAVDYNLKKSRLEIALNDFVAARSPLDSLRLFFIQHPERVTKEHNLRMAELEHDLARQAKDVEAERLWSDTIVSLIEQINDERSAKQVSSIQRLSQITLDKSKREFEKNLQLSEQKVRLRNFVLLFVGLFSTLLLGIGYLVYKVRLQHRQMENQRLELELSHKNRDISNLAMDISRRKEAAEEVLNYLEELKSNKKRPERIDLAAIERDLKKRIKADEKREWVHSQVEDINSAFYDRLRTKHPTLTPTEMELCAMIRSRMSNKQIAEIRNITPESASKARYRLGRKLGVAEGQDMVELLNEI